MDDRHEGLVCDRLNICQIREGEGYMKLVVLGLFFVLFLSSCISTTDCGENMPQILVYPNSTLIQTGEGRSNDVKLISFQSSTDSTWEDIVDFYRDKMLCRFSQDRIVCETHADPYGEYSVYIDKTNNPTTVYVISVSWHRVCSDETLN